MHALLWLAGLAVGSAVSTHEGFALPHMRGALGLRKLSQMRYEEGVEEGVTNTDSLRSNREYLPVPPESLEPAIPVYEGYLVEELGSGAYFVTDGVDQLMFVERDEGMVLVGAPESPGFLTQDRMESTLADIIRSVTDKPVTHIIYPNHHLNSVGAAGRVIEAYRDEAIIEVIAHEDTVAGIATRNAYGELVGTGRRTPEPTLTFSGNYTLTDAAGRPVLELMSLGLGHDRGVLYVLHPASGVLLVDNMLWPGWVPFEQFGLSGDLLGFLAAHDVILGLFDSANITYVLGGHTNRKGVRRDVEIQREYVLDITTAIRALRDPRSPLFVSTAPMAVELGVLDPDSANFGNGWLVYQVYAEEVSAQCAHIVLSKTGVAGRSNETQWPDVLGAVDVFTNGNCWSMLLSDRLDLRGSAVRNPYVTP